MPMCVSSRVTRVAVRKLAQEVVELLQSTPRLREERAKAADLTRKLYGASAGVGTGTTFGAPPAVGSGAKPAGVGSGDFHMSKEERFGGVSASAGDHSFSDFGPEGVKSRAEEHGHAHAGGRKPAHKASGGEDFDPFGAEDGPPPPSPKAADDDDPFTSHPAADEGKGKHVPRVKIGASTTVHAKHPAKVEHSKPAIDDFEPFEETGKTAVEEIDFFGGSGGDGFGTFAGTSGAPPSGAVAFDMFSVPAGTPQKPAGPVTSKPLVEGDDELNDLVHLDALSLSGKPSPVQPTGAKGKPKPMRTMGASMASHTAPTESVMLPHSAPMGGSAMPMPMGGGGYPSMGGAMPMGGGGYPSMGGAMPMGGGYPPMGGAMPMGGGGYPSMGGAMPMGGGYPSMGGAMPMGGGYPPMGGAMPMGGGYPPMGGAMPMGGGGYPPMGGAMPMGGGRPTAGGNPSRPMGGGATSTGFPF
jgi:hypothetical protein